VCLLADPWAGDHSQVRKLREVTLLGGGDQDKDKEKVTGTKLRGRLHLQAYICCPHKLQVLNSRPGPPPRGSQSRHRCSQHKYSSCWLLGAAW
jgi:hypothetical protein